MVTGRTGEELSSGLHQLPWREPSAAASASSLPPRPLVPSVDSSDCQSLSHLQAASDFLVFSFAFALSQGSPLLSQKTSPHCRETAPICSRVRPAGILPAASQPACSWAHLSPALGLSSPHICNRTRLDCMVSKSFNIPVL